MAVALRYPIRAVRPRIRPVAVLLGVAMLGMALLTTAVSAAALGIGFGAAALLGAALAPTDPVLASSVVTGEPAEKGITARTRQLLSLESGANDGLGLPLVLAAVAIAGPADSHEKDLAADAGARLVERYEDLVRSEFSGLTVAGELPMGNAAAVLLERSADADVLVVGHRGSGGFPRLPLGSVSWQVATHAQCPVIVVRPGDTSGPPDNRVVVGADPASGSLGALDFAYHEADLLGARLEVVHGAYHPGTVPSGPVMAPPDFHASDHGPRDSLEKEIAQQRNQYPSVEVDLRIEHTRPATLLAEAARSAALLVVGSRGRSGMKRLLLGSVSSEVLHTAECPVAVVPGQERD